jgi:predicted GH43/DUF377 family glycosyl hydrolase
MSETALESIDSTVTRLGVVLRPNGDPVEAEGVLNPAAARTRDGQLLLYPRVVAHGNVSRIAIAQATGSADEPSFERRGFALEPEAHYELREAPGGYGCEDARVTFVAALDLYLMAYTAYGPEGPRIALAVSHDAYAWSRLGLIDFSGPDLPCGDDKDAAFFPEPVLSPKGVPSFAFYHRPMLHLSALDGCSAVPVILDMPPERRESTRVAYVALEPALRDTHNLLKVTESALVLPPDAAWGSIKTGAGTPPVRVAEGWMSLFHGVDARFDESGKCVGMRYSSGLVIHDAQYPHIVRYRSPAPLLVPEIGDELRGVVDEVVFPTGIDVRPGSRLRAYDIYYGMADARVGRAHMELGRSVAVEAEESAA